jgi:hypothetical protein
MHSYLPKETDMMVTFTFYPFTTARRVHASNWIEGWISQKADQNTAAKTNCSLEPRVKQKGKFLRYVSNYEVLLRRIPFQAADSNSSRRFLLPWAVILAVQNHKLQPMEAKASEPTRTMTRHSLQYRSIIHGFFLAHPSLCRDEANGMK